MLPLSHRFLKDGVATVVIWVPHSSGGEIHFPEFIPLALGFDSARAVTSEFTGNIATDSTSSKKYYHFIGCGSSTLTLEAALQTRPTFCLITEEAIDKGWTLNDVVQQLCDSIVQRRHHIGKRSGTVLIAGAFIESLSEMPLLQKEVYDCTRPHGSTIATEEELLAALSPSAALLFSLLPKLVQHSLLFREDGKGRPLMPSIASERLLGHLIFEELQRRKENGSSNCVDTFNYRLHNLVQESRCSMPTTF
ncbi:hypothetical protein IE077_004274, partial [Cardiosporidium cionae]